MLMKDIQIIYLKLLFFYYYTYNQKFVTILVTISDYIRQDQSITEKKNKTKQQHNKKKK